MGSGVIFRGHSSDPITVATGLTLLAVSLFAIVTFSVQQYQSATLLFAYAGGMAMLLTPCRFPVVLAIVPLCRRGLPRAASRSPWYSRRG